MGESMSVAANPVVGSDSYFMERAESLGDDVNEAKFEPMKAKRSERDDDSEGHNDLGDSLDSGVAAAEKETLAQPVQDDIVGTNEEPLKQVVAPPVDNIYMTNTELSASRTTRGSTVTSSVCSALPTWLV